MLRRRRSSRALLILDAEAGARLRRQIDGELLAALQEHACEAGGPAARLAWERTGALGTRHLLAIWPEELPSPSVAVLRSPRRFRSGFALHLELPAVDVEAYADRLLRQLGSRPAAGAAAAEPQRTRPPAPPSSHPRAPEELAAPVELHEEDPVAEPRPRPGSARMRSEHPLAPGPPGGPATGPAPRAPRPTQAAGFPDPAEVIAEAEAPVVPQPAEAPEEAALERLPEGLVEVLPPGARVEKPVGRRWNLGEGDVFTMFGPLHHDDIYDDGLEIQAGDVEWLNPGDRVISQRRGPCRILKAEPRHARVAVEDASGAELWIRFDELTAEFFFDDGAWVMSS